MPKTCEVENQRFTFGDEWTIAFKYDDTRFHQREAVCLQGIIDGVPHSTKAVDVIALHQISGLLFLEAKDFRGHKIANKQRLKGEVAVEVAVKARDTIAALIGAARKLESEFPSDELVAAMSSEKEILVVLWLEDDTFQDPREAKATLGVLNQRLKSLLSWLNVRTFVLSSSVPNRINHLTVTNSSGAGQPNP